MVDETLAFIGDQNENARYPGQSSMELRHLHQKDGVEIPEKLWNEIQNL